LQEPGSFHHVMVDEFGKRLVLGWSPTPEDKQIRAFIECVDEMRPDLVGISLTTVALQASIAITRAVRKQLPSVPAVWGGIEPTIEPERCLEHADMVCMGEGEEVMVELCDRLDSNRDYADVRNLWVKRDGEIVRNPLRPLVADLDNLPFPDYSPEHNILLEEGMRREYGFDVYDNEYDSMTARGCPFACTFCCNSQLHKLYPGQPRVRRRSVRNVIEELRQAKERFGIEYVRFNDDVFTDDVEWLEEFARQYREHVGLPFWCNTHPAYSDLDALRFIKEAGVHSVTMGIQSGSERILRQFYARPTKSEKIIETAATMARIGISANYDIITNNPFETDDDCRDTFDLLLSLPKPMRLNGGMTELSLFPNTRIARMVEEQSPPPVDGRMFDFWNRMYLLTQHTYRFVPRNLLRAMSRSRLLRNNPWLLRPFLWVQYLKLLVYYWHRFTGWLRGNKRHQAPHQPAV